MARARNCPFLYLRLCRVAFCCKEALLCPHSQQREHSFPELAMKSTKRSSISWSVRGRARDMASVRPASLAVPEVEVLYDRTDCAS